MSKLAINRGSQIRTIPFPFQQQIGEDEIMAANRVLKTGLLSHYRGNWQNFKGGEEIQKLEENWSIRFGNKYSIACNSCTSALIIACGVIGLKPGDEVIVTPYSMTCSATAPMHWGAIPVFADIEKDFFCLDPESVRSKITDKTKAIIAVDLFGQPYSRELMEIAKKNNLYLIEDAAQAVGSEQRIYTEGYDPKTVIEGTPEYSTKYTGTFGHIGCFSFTQGKHITAGEGGMITTDDIHLAEKCRLLMNHAEAVINDAKGLSEGTTVAWKKTNDHMFGYNNRLTELQAAIINSQVDKIGIINATRQENAAYMAVNLQNEFPFIKSAKIRKDCTHTYYAQAFLYDRGKADGIHRDKFIDAVKVELTPMAQRENEGVRIGNGYIKPLYRMPVFADRFKDVNASWTVGGSYKDQYIKRLPNVERLWKDELFLHLYLAAPTAKVDLDDIINAFKKVWQYRDELR